MIKCSTQINRLRFVAVLGCMLLLLFTGCKRKRTAQTAFYYWKTVLQLNKKESELLRTVGNNHIYLRFFDVVWNVREQQALPDGVLAVKTNLQGLSVTPVIYMTNQSLLRSDLTEMDSLAFKVNRLVGSLSAEQGITYKNIQIDCDWSVATKTKYFNFLRAFKRYNGKQLESTIRLHQVKYPERTGVPPVDKGLLMFYNMGKISGDLNAQNSIYNEGDAAAYIAALPNYQLPLDVALPLFSWAIQIRGNKVAQVYAKITRRDLSNQQNFEALPPHGSSEPAYRSLKSFYLKGVYVKKGDLFKFEGMDAEKLTQAAKQVAEYLAPLENRNIIYYEISSISLSSLYAKDIEEISSHF